MNIFDIGAFVLVFAFLIGHTNKFVYLSGGHVHLYSTERILENVFDLKVRRPIQLRFGIIYDFIS